MLVILGLGFALVLAWGTIKLGEWLQHDKGYGFSRRVAVGIGFALGLIIWAVLTWLTPVPRELIIGLAVGPGVGLAQGLTREQEQRKGR